MPRKSAKSTPVSGPRSSSKRAAPDKATPTRQSKRTKATPAKSPYFKPDSDEEVDGHAPEVAESEDYENESDQNASESDDEVDDSSDEDEAPRARSRGRTAAKGSALPLRKKGGGAGEAEPWRHGAKLAPGTQVVIKKPKPRGAGNVLYEDHTIHPNTMLFLADLATNNDRQWLKMHDPDYRISLQDFTTFLEKLSEKIVEVDETIPELPVKDITHFSAAWSRTGRKGPYAAYYFQAQPGGSFVGGGLWQPEAQALGKLRRDIDRKPHKIKRVLNDAGVRKSFFEGIGNDEKKAVTAFTKQSSNQSTALKKHPKGYDNGHKDIELLRLRNFTLGTKLRDEEVVGPKGLERIAGLLACLVPFITYLNGVVMPDEESSGSSEDEEEATDEGLEPDNEAEGDA
ncbi:hypothetical protein BDV96DRAFT_491180 [Lophiotrema nucula]|uniref:Uncharacterized protein n=1 Tax=Lophiotrema nucula TaxID=690887 RepID=A0A6A5ZAT3_9PLEO|nr:hypothetical protein BDV96DRAFT_491180 [Lophiotrema nucula]